MALLECFFGNMIMSNIFFFFFFINHCQSLLLVDEGLSNFSANATVLRLFQPICPKRLNFISVHRVLGHLLRLVCPHDVDVLMRRSSPLSHIYASCQFLMILIAFAFFRPFILHQSGIDLSSFFFY